MPKRITETTERWCCQAKDLEVLEPIKAVGLSKASTQYEKLDRFCKHCGQIFEYYRFMDAAGSTDWNYRPKNAQ